VTIGIDAHWLEGNRTGVGRYVFSLLKQWSIMQNAQTPEYEHFAHTRFVLYFKDEIPLGLPQSPLFEEKLLKVKSMAKFIHWDLCRAASKDKVDMLFCPGYIAPIFYRGKIALTLHDIIYAVHPEWFEWKSWADKILLKWVSRVSARKAAIIFTISDFSQQEIIRHFNIAPEKIKVTYLAADSGLMGENADFGEIKRKYGLENNFAFFVGSIFNRRHLPEVIEGFCKIVQEKQDFQFLLAGKDNTDPSQKIDVIIKAANEKLGRRAILRVDFVSDSELKLLYRACVFFIYLSDYEGFGLPPLEAMQNGAPVITSASSSLKEVAGEAALLIKDNYDVEEIYGAMEKIIEDVSLRQELIRRGKMQAEKFSWKRCAEETLKSLISAIS